MDTGEEGVVRVGRKSKKDYLNASLFCLDKFGKARIRGLGGRQGLVLEIAETLGKVDGLEVTAINGIMVEDTAGIEVVIEQRGGSDDE